MRGWDIGWTSARDMGVSVVMDYHGWVALFGTIVIVAMSYVTIYLLVLAFRRNQRVGRLKIRTLFFTITIESSDRSVDPRQDIEMDRKHHPSIPKLSKIRSSSSPAIGHRASLV
jgi:hypothetical protein